MSQADWDHLKAYKKEIIKGNTIADVWSVSDVMVQASNENLDRHFKIAEARQVLQQLQNDSDASVGINWDTISFWIHEIYAEKVGI